MRARNIKPNLFKNEILGTEDPFLTILFTGLWCLADKRGRLEDRPLRIKAEVFPYRDNLDVNGYLTVLERLGFIQRYVIDQVPYIQVLHFEKHQHPHHTEKESEIPPPPSIKSLKNNENRDLTVKQQETNGCAPSDSLIPDSLIPEKKARAKNPRTPPPSAFVLPDWIPSDAWNDFEDHRKTIRKPLTDKSRKLAVAELSKLRDLGYPPDDVLAQSILNGWTGLFPLKGFSRPSTNGSHPPRKKTLIEQVLEANGITAEDIQSDKEIVDVD